MMLAEVTSPLSKSFDRRRIHGMRHAQVIGMYDHQFRVPRVAESFRQGFRDSSARALCWR